MWVQTRSIFYHRFGGCYRSEVSSSKQKVIRMVLLAGGLEEMAVARQAAKETARQIFVGQLQSRAHSKGPRKTKCEATVIKKQISQGAF